MQIDVDPLASLGWRSRVAILADSLTRISHRMIRTPCGEEKLLLGDHEVNNMPTFACCYGGKGKD